MSEMIERVAKVLAIADGMHPEAVSNDEDQVPAWKLYLDDARAAVEAMREPTEAMIQAAVTADYGKTLGDRITNTHNAMIDAALTPASEAIYPGPET